MRRRLLQFPNVRLRERCEALEVVVDRDQGCVAGVRIQSRGGHGAEMMSADLVVDASGRGSRSPAWLAALGYAKPREESIKVDIGYMTRQYRRLPQHLHGKNGVLIGACPPNWRFGAILVQEGERWIVSLGGYLGDQIPADEAGFHKGRRYCSDTCRKLASKARLQSSPKRAEKSRPATRVLSTVTRVAPVDISMAYEGQIGASKSSNDLWRVHRRARPGLAEDVSGAPAGRQPDRYGEPD